MKKLILITITLTTLSLQACMGGIFLAGAATGGAIIHDKRPVKVIADDEKIRHQITYKILKSPELRDSHIIVSSFRHDVLLAGQSPQASKRVFAEKLAHSVRGVNRIYNEITIGSPSSAVTRSSDAWITTKVKAKMLTKHDLDSGQIKVVTENGTVYLLGHLNKKQARLAVDVARRVSGVQKVVKVFQYNVA